MEVEKIVETTHHDTKYPLLMKGCFMSREDSVDTSRDH